MHETRSREHPGSPRDAGASRREEPLDDWLGEISDRDWDEEGAARHGTGRAVAAGGASRLDTPDVLWAAPEATTASPAGGGADADTRRATIERRRYTAGLVLLVLVGLAAGVSVLVFRGGGNDGPGDVAPPVFTTPATPEPVTTTPATPPATTTSEPPSGTTTPPTTPPSSTGSAMFALPQGTKLRPGGGDPATVKQLQQALAAAGYDPGSADGDFGPGTKAAVVAFQQANGLDPDGVVGPDTAAALNAALASG